MRRILAFLLSFYILGLVSIPCADKDLNLMDHRQTHITHEDSGEHAEHHDGCSPFCTCSCCNISMEPVMALLLPSEVTVIRELEFFFLPDFHSDYVLSFWEPPKIG